MGACYDFVVRRLPRALFLRFAVSVASVPPMVMISEKGWSSMAEPLAPASRTRPWTRTSKASEPPARSWRVVSVEGCAAIGVRGDGRRRGRW